MNDVLRVPQARGTCLSPTRQGRGQDAPGFSGAAGTGRGSGVDGLALTRVSRSPPQLCTCDKLWEKIVLSACDTVTPDMRALAEDMGWRQMFFTNKLQLQRRLRKRRQGQGSHRNSQL